MDKINVVKKMKTYFKNKGVLVTGGLGFIGSNLAIDLVKLGANVTILDSKDPSYGANNFNINPIKDKVSLKIGDLRNEKLISELVKTQGIIFNLAGQISHSESMENPLKDLEMNSRAHLILLEACRKHNDNVSIVFTSTRQIYGRPNYLPLDEKHPITPIDINGINKFSGESFHLLYNNVYNLKATCLRLTNTYGPRQLLKGTTQGFIPIFIRQIINNEEIKIFGNGEQLRDINYIEDVNRALLSSALHIKKTQGEIFNLGNSPVSLKQFTETLIKVHSKGNYSLIPFPENKRKIDIGGCYCSYEKIKSILGWKPQITLEHGLKKTLGFYSQYKQHYL